MQFFTVNDSFARDISGAGNHRITLTDLQPDTEYTVQVAALYGEGVVGPYADPIPAATLPASSQGEL